MRRSIIETTQILIGIVALVVAWAIGGYFGGWIVPTPQLLNKIETLPNKIGSSIAILAAALLLTRYFFRFLRQIVLSFLGVEIFALLIILFITGDWSIMWFDIGFNFGWLFTITWNVAVACFIGAAIGHILHKKAANQ